MNSRITTPPSSKSSTREISAEQLLRDLAFVLRMTRKVKSEMLCEPASATDVDSDQIVRPEPGVCAI